MLELKSISKTFNPGTVNEKCALHDLSLSVPDGDFITIIGANGAGKSTLFGAIGGNFLTDSGEILLDGQNVTFWPEHRRSKVIGRLFQDPMKGTAPNLTIEENLALAYSINSLSKTMGTADYIISMSEGFLTPALLPAIIFVISAIMAFATGSSWGTFAICMPIALPLAFTFTGGELGTLVYACFGAVAGGGVFGDHCSPLSDTTVLSSTGSASDHIDHVQTQLPYALCCGALAIIVYLIIGFTSL